MTRVHRDETQTAGYEKTKALYKEERRKYTNLIRQSKRGHWNQIYLNLEDVWGERYKIVTKEGIGFTQVNITEEKKEK